VTNFISRHLIFRDIYGEVISLADGFKRVISRRDLQSLVNTNVNAGSANYSARGAPQRVAMSSLSFSPSPRAKDTSEIQSWTRATLRCLLKSEPVSLRAFEGRHQRSRSFYFTPALYSRLLSPFDALRPMPSPLFLLSLFAIAILWRVRARAGIKIPLKDHARVQREETQAVNGRGCLPPICLWTRNSPRCWAPDSRRLSATKNKTWIRSSATKLSGCQSYKGIIARSCVLVMHE